MNLKKTFLLGAGAALLSANAFAENITVVSWGGALSEAQRKAYHEPFMKETGHTILEDEWAGEVSAIAAIVETGNYKWDIIVADTMTALSGCDQGVLEPIDLDILGLTAADFIEGGLLECSVGTSLWATVMAYRTDVYPTDAPKTWVDFWDTKKYPGKRGMNKSSYHGFEIALMADGVAPGDVYAVLKAEGGVDRALASLAKIKDHVVWWEQGAQAPQLLADKEVVMTNAWNGRIYGAVTTDNQPFAIAWWGQLYEIDHWMIPKGHPEKKLLHEFIAFASRPDRQGDQTNYISYGNTRLGADKYANPDIAPHLPTAGANFAVAVKTDALYWGDQWEDNEKKFLNLLTQ